MELLDQIDMHENVVGVTNKETAHANNLMHRCVAIFVFNTTGELYVQVHKVNNGLYDSSVGGHVKKGETYGTAAAREAREELGINQPLQFVTKIHSPCSISNHMFSLYECVANKNWQFVPNQEVETIIPMKLDAIWQMMQNQPERFTPDFIKIMNEYRKIMNSI